MKIALVCGSVAKKSHTRALLTYIQTLLKQEGAEVVFWDLREKPLPVLIPEFHRNPIETPDKSVKEFITLVKESDGLILGTPLYHGSYSGVLKSALDNLGGDYFRDKVVGLVGNGSNVRAPQALDHLRLVVRTLYGYATQSHIATMGADYKDLGENYELSDEDIKARCVRLVKELLNLAKLYKQHAPNKKD